MKLLSGYVVIVLLTCFAFSCNSTKVANTDTISGKYWKLVVLNGKDIEDYTTPGKEPHIIFDGNENRAYGNAGCNNFSGGYEISEDSRIHFNAMASTKMMCEEMEIEQFFLNVFSNAEKYILTGDTLELHNSKMETLAIFVAMKLNKLQ
ncbi:MAG: META domain-containing protein [Candidatus Kapabacteria bacterium]|nr:META domain-containing protein [Ignavibacteriota bacterium]MCW5885957.1 META domain-containing protein [Candidatus Kapabacteria bacterium]